VAEVEYDAAKRALLSYSRHAAGVHGREWERIQAIPGFQEAAKNALPSGDATAAVAHLSPQIMEVQVVFAAEHKEVEREWFDVVTAVGLLDETDIRKMLDAFAGDDEAPLHDLCRSLSESKNPAATTPLIDRLRIEVIPPRRLRRNPLNAWILGLIFRERHFVRNVVEGNRWMDRAMTMRALARLGDDRAEAAIMPFLSDRNEQVRKSAEAALRIWQRTRDAASA